MVGQMEAENEVVAYLMICGNISRNFIPSESNGTELRTP
jgi:hypothetical protein